MATLAVSVVSADREVWSGEASLVVARTVEGEIGIMPGHEPMLAILAAGEVRLTLPGGKKIEASAEDGFLSVQSNQVQIVASRAALA
ncbi:MAG: ATP synthase F1 subunit epsilon [Candidatus Lumbricidophila eiseniae]|uniref:ATP synthase F1 subunit epsilon n=1 Tax=Candidatus Lumbricidiphila eiseniae TaxID=1969409 RepID=A0A2A6FSE6_9MICO|nr:MAG: ATP synthase F1 subunit epsilon [Candidatus Lumbricidophila eiseniae]